MQWERAVYIHRVYGCYDTRFILWRESFQYETQLATHRDVNLYLIAASHCCVTLAHPWQREMWSCTITCAREILLRYNSSLGTIRWDNFLAWFFERFLQHSTWQDSRTTLSSFEITSSTSNVVADVTARDVTAVLLLSGNF